MSVLVQSAPIALKPLQGVENLPPEPKTFTRREVMGHCDSRSCWIIVEDKVYDITEFLSLHPGGEEIMLEYAGGEASAAFWDKGHSKNATRMLQQYYIGDIKEEPKVSRGLTSVLSALLQSHG